MDGHIIFNELEERLKELGLQLTQIDYSPGHNPEITAIFRNWTDDVLVEWKSLEDSHCNRNSIRKPMPKKVIFSGPATTILWKDGTKTTVKCQRHDIWADEVGVAMCYLKKMLGNKGNYNNIFREAMKVANKKEEIK